MRLPDRGRGQLQQPGDRPRRQAGGRWHVPVIDHFGFSDTYTNIDTGEWFTITGKATFVEISATRVDGPIFEFRHVEAGQPFVVRDSEGNLVARNRGSVQPTYLFDTGGDEPGGEPMCASLGSARIAAVTPA